MANYSAPLSLSVPGSQGGKERINSLLRGESENGDISGIFYP